MSFGGAEESVALHDAVKEASNKGILLVAAAGNRGAGTETELYPARYPEVVSVGAVNRNFNRASFSSTGAELDLVAPGTGILSTTMDGGYGTMSGTSMAAPHVTGAAAVLWAKNKELSSEDVKKKLYQTATPLGDAHDYGHGFVNLAYALGIVNGPIVSQTPDPEPVITPPVNSSPTTSYDINKVDNKILELSKELLRLKEVANDNGNVSLAKTIEQQYNDLLVMNTELHKLPVELTQSNPKQNLTQEQINQYYETKANEFQKLENIYNKIIDQLRNKMKLTSYNKSGDGQTIAPGGSATVSVYLDTPKTRIDITVYNASNPSQIIASTSYYNVSANVPVSYTWNSASTTVPGTYKIHYAYPDNGTNTQWDDYFTIYVQYPTLYLNSPVDVDLPAGQYRVYKFTPSTTGAYKIYTGPYGGTGPSNDTYLEMYSDSNLTNMIAYNRFNPSSLESISLILLES